MTTIIDVYETKDAFKGIEESCKRCGTDTKGQGRYVTLDGIFCVDCGPCSRCTSIAKCIGIGKVLNCNFYH